MNREVIDRQSFLQRSTSATVSYPMTPPEPLTIRGSMKVGFYTAQLGVEAIVTPQTLTIRAPMRTFQIDRQHFRSLEETSLLGIFKRGIRFHHDQPGLASNVVFYPSLNCTTFREMLSELGW